MSYSVRYLIVKELMRKEQNEAEASKGKSRRIEGVRWSAELAESVRRGLVQPQGGDITARLGLGRERSRWLHQLPIQLGMKPVFVRGRLLPGCPSLGGRRRANMF